MGDFCVEHHPDQEESSGVARHSDGAVDALGERGRERGGEDPGGGPNVEPEGRAVAVVEGDAGDTPVGAQAGGPVTWRAAFRRVPVPHSVRPRVAVAGDELVHGLEEVAGVPSLDVHDADTVLLLETARGRAGDLAVAAGSLGRTACRYGRYGRWWFWATTRSDDPTGAAPDASSS